jgi:hypothetical protein
VSENAALVALFAFAVGLFGSGVAVGWKLNGDPVRMVSESDAPEQVEPDGGLTLAKRTAGAPPAGDAPSGHRPVRVVDVTVQPAGPVAAAPMPPECAEWADTLTCPPVTARVTFSQADDGTLRATARAQDGALLGGADYPIGDLMVRDHRRWALGVSIPVDSSGGYGLAVQRDVWRLRVGADLYPQTGQQTSLTGRLNVVLPF